MTYDKSWTTFLDHTFYADRRRIQRATAIEGPYPREDQWRTHSGRLRYADECGRTANPVLRLLEG